MANKDKIEKLDEDLPVDDEQKKNADSNKHKATSNLKNRAIQAASKKAGGAIGGALGGAVGKKVGEKLGEKLGNSRTNNNNKSNFLNNGRNIINSSSNFTSPSTINNVNNNSAQSSTSTDSNSAYNNKESKNTNNEKNDDKDVESSSSKKSKSSFLNNKLDKFSGTSQIFGKFSIKTVITFFAPILGIFFLILLFFVIFSSIGNTFSIALGAENGDEYSSAEFKIFNDNLNSIKSEYSKAGKTVNVSMVSAVFSIISMEGGNLNFDTLSKDEIKKVVDASLKNNKYDEDTFKENLKDIFKSYFPSYSDGQINSLINNVIDFSDGYSEIVKDNKKNTTTKATGSEAYWWPIGSSETTDENGKTFASGEPETTNITSSFGPRDLTSSGFHNGLDISNNSRNTNIIASKSGEVIYPSSNDKIDYGDGYVDNTDGGGLGNYVLIKHSDGNYTVYGHMEANSIKVFAGETVKQGQVLGKIGTSGSSTGVHLHFGVYVGEFGNSFAVDPLTYVSADDTRPVVIGSDFSLTATVLSEDEFVAKMEDYGSRANNDAFNTNFLSNARLIYQKSVEYGVNPELVVVTAKSESNFEKCGNIDNYWGVGIPNGKGCSDGPNYSSMTEGIKGYADTLKEYQEGGSKASTITDRYNERSAAQCSAGGYGLPGTLSGMQSIYSWVGSYRYNPGDWGIGGCAYLELDAMYGAGYCSTVSTCTDYGSCPTDSATSICEQSDYTLWQISKKIADRQEIFGL